MKHIVTLTISNPSHEHVSLRRRQSTTNYMVEARDESEAILRASNHFKKLGNYVHNAVIAEGAMKRHAEEQDDAGMSDYEHYMQTKDKKRQVEPPPSAMPSDTRIKPLPKKGNRTGSFNKFGHYTPGVSEEIEQVEEDTRLPPKFYKKIVDKLNKKKAGMKEEVEQIDELKKSTLASYITKASRQSSALHSLGKEFDNDKHMYAQKALNARTPKTKEKAKADMETSGRLASRFTRKAHNRTAGISRAAVKLAKEEVKSDATNAMSDTMKKKHISDKDKSTLSKLHALMKAQKKLVKEEVEQIDELDAGKGSILDRATKAARSKFKLSDINVRGTGMSKKTRDAHDRYTKFNFKLNQANAAKRAADASGTKYSDEYVSNIRQGKAWDAAVAKVKADRKAASDAKKAAKMAKEEVEQVSEVLKPSMGASAYIHDFVHSDNPKFAGKTKAERTKMALGAFYAAKKGK